MNDSLGNSRALLVYIFEEVQDSAVKRIPSPPLLGVWGALELRSRYLSNLTFLAPPDEDDL